MTVLIVRTGSRDAVEDAAMGPLAVWTVWSWVPPVWNLLVLLTSLFLILLVLIQRGKGGGLAGAFGAAGGSSAFGSRAGDTFTRVTIFTAAVWVLMIMIMIKMVQPVPTTKADTGGVQQPAPSGPAEQ
jgi:preprotein translocase subunit SecG